MAARRAPTVAPLRRVRGAVTRRIPSPTAPGATGRVAWELAVAPDRWAARRLGVDRGVEPDLVERLRRDGVATTDAGLLGGERVVDALRDRWRSWAAAHPEVISVARARAGEAAEDKSFLVRLSDHLDDALDPDDPLVAPLLSRPLLDVVARHLGSVPLLLYADIWLTLPTGRPPLRSQHWHRDPEDRRIVKVFTLLDEVTSANGPLWFVPGTHRRGAVRGDPDWFKEPGRGANRATDAAVGAMVEPSRWWEGTGPRGMVTLADTTGLHRGGHLETGERLLHTATFATAASAQRALQRLTRPPADRLARAAARRMLEDPPRGS